MSKINDRTLQILREHTNYTKQEDETIIARIDIPLDRGEYNDVKRVFSLLGGKWNKKKEGTVFALGTNPEEYIDLDKGVVNKLEDDYFPTPGNVLEIMKEHIPQSPGKVLEPSAGTGALCELVAQFSPERIDVIELNEKRQKLLQEQGHNLIGTDFAKTKPPQVDLYDTVIMNPPFAKRQDIKHIEKAYDKWLKDGGTIIAIMLKRGEGTETGLSFNADVTVLPKGSFSGSGKGTGVDTLLVVAKKSKENSILNTETQESGKGEDDVLEEPAVLITRIEKNTQLFMEKLRKLKALEEAYSLEPLELETPIVETVSLSTDQSRALNMSDLSELSQMSLFDA